MPFKKYLFAGLLVWTPLVITVWVLTWLVGMMDGIFYSAAFQLLPAETLTSVRAITGLGVVLVFLILLITGALVSNVVGRFVMK